VAVASLRVQPSGRGAAVPDGDDDLESHSSGQNTVSALPPDCSQNPAGGERGASRSTNHLGGAPRSPSASPRGPRQVNLRGACAAGRLRVPCASGPARCPRQLGQYSLCNAQARHPKQEAPIWGTCLL